VEGTFASERAASVPRARLAAPTIPHPAAGEPFASKGPFHNTATSNSIFETALTNKQKEDATPNHGGRKINLRMESRKVCR